MKLSSICCVSAAVLAFNAFGTSITKTDTGAIVGADNGTNVAVDFYSPSAVRISKFPEGNDFNKQSLAVIAAPERIPLKIARSNGSTTIAGGNIAVVVSDADGTVTFADGNGSTLLAEESAATFTPFDDAGESTFTVKQSFRFDPNEHIYGLGNIENGKLSQRGVAATLQPGNIDDGIPVFTSTKGYGLYWDNYAPTQFGEADNVAFFESSPGDGVDYYFMYGPTADDVIASLRHLTGHVPMQPRWSYGFWQSKERYKSQDELLGVLAEYRRRNIPIDGMIQDWQYWGNNYLWNAMEFMNEDFRNPQEMIDSVHRSNAHLIISIWSSFGPRTKPYRELDEKGMLFNFSTWPQSGISHEWPPRMDYPSGVRVYDAYNPEARDIYWKNLRRIHDMGMDGWWMDSTEPDHYDVTKEDMDTKTHLGSFRKVRGAYPLMTVEGVYNHQLADAPNKRVFILTRSGWAGQQRTGSNVWTGDVVSTWDALRKQIPALLNFSLTGNPNCNTDLGGFFAGGYNLKGLPAVKNPAFHELYVRWMQFGALTPMMRSHGTDVPREIYLYGSEGEPVYDAMVDAVKLRYALLPYIYSTARRVSADDYTFMRALMMDFPTDTVGLTLSTQYMFGPSLLVAPVLNPQYTPEDVRKITADEGWNKAEAGKNGQSNTDFRVDFTEPRSVDVYLPEGTQWWEFWTSQQLSGGQWIKQPTTFNRIPLYVRAGSILPIGPDVQFADEKPWDDLEIRVYPGADGTFTLYEDEGSNLDYEKGLHSEIPFSWNNARHTLTIGRRTGSYPGMIERRKFRIVLPDGSQKSVEYDGRQQKVKF